MDFDHLDLPALAPYFRDRLKLVGTESLILVLVARA